MLRGDARQLPRPDASVDLIVTSPPYFGLRSYTDGGQHYEPRTQAYDQRRTQILTARRIRVLRFPNDVILREPDSVAAAIAGALGFPHLP